MFYVLLRFHCGFYGSDIYWPLLCWFLIEVSLCLGALV